MVSVGWQTLNSFIANMELGFKIKFLKGWQILHILFATLATVNWQVINLFTTTTEWSLQPNNSTISTLLFAGLQHTQQCQVIFSVQYLVFVVAGFEPTTLWTWVFCLNHYTTAPRQNFLLNLWIFKSRLNLNCCCLFCNPAEKVGKIQFNYR